MGNAYLLFYLQQPTPVLSPESKLSTAKETQQSAVKAEALATKPTNTGNKPSLIGPKLPSAKPTIVTPKPTLIGESPSSSKIKFLNGFKPTSEGSTSAASPALSTKPETTKTTTPPQ